VLSWVVVAIVGLLDFLNRAAFTCMSLQVTKARFSANGWTAGLVGPARPCAISFGVPLVPRFPAELVVPRLQIEIVAGVEGEDATLDAL